MKNFILFAVAAIALSAPSSEAAVKRVCKSVKSSRGGEVCADLQKNLKKKTFILSEIQYTNPKTMTTSPIQFRRGTAKEICSLFNSKKKPVGAEVVMADGVSLPSRSRNVAGSGPAMTSYDEVTCRR